MGDAGRLADLVILITGAAGGIGRACALRLAEEGAALILVDRGRTVGGLPYATAGAEQLEEVATEARQRGHQVVTALADVRELPQLEGAVSKSLDKFQRIDGLVAAAGVDSWGNCWELSEEQWQLMLDVNLTGVWKIARAVAPTMIERASGSMVFISSVLGHKPNRHFAHYTAAKPVSYTHL